MATHLVTGYAGVQHIAAADDATLHASVVGTGKYVFDSGKKFEYEIVSNNMITIKDGDLMNQGRHIKIAVNDYEELQIDNGLAGVKRYDLICMRYNKNADTNIEHASLVVIKGTSSESPTDPEYISGDILGGDLEDDFPLYRVRLDGLSIVGVDCLFDVIPSVESVHKDVVAIQANLAKSGEWIDCTALASSVESSKKTAIASIVFPEDGIYALKCGARWSGNANGVRMFAVNGSLSEPPYDLCAYENSNTQLSPQSFTFTQQYDIIIKSKKGNTLYLWAWQNSGATLGIALHNLTARRIV